MLLAKDRIMILDGAMGTMLQRHGLQGNSEEFNLSHPEVIRSIHQEYIEVGVDIISTNSFSANSISQAAYGLQDKARQLAFEAARIAREAAGQAPRKVWVAGSIGPTGKSLSLAQDIADPASRPYSFDDMAEAFEEQVLGLVEGGVDVLLLETSFDALNSKAAICAIEKVAPGFPVMISVSASDRSGRTLTGQTIEAFYRSVQHAGPISFGLNCSLGAEDLAPMMAEVSSWAECPVSCYPNAGLPNEMGEYEETPEHMAEAMVGIAKAGHVNIVGGCCGTTPEHIRAIAKAMEGIAPRPVPEPDGILHVSGLEPVAIDVRKNNFTNIGERTNVAGSRKFARLIASGDYETALQIASSQIENGASIIDVNMDDAMLDSAKEMEKFLRYISNDPAVAKAAIMIDSSHWETVLSGLKNAQGKCIVNSISLKEGEEVFLSKAKEIKKLGAAVVVIAFDEQGQATTYDRKIEICERAYSLLTEKAGFQPEEIIFDVNVLPIGTGIPEHARHGIDFIEAVRWIKKNLPGSLTSGGISNLSFSFRGNNAVREAMHSVFLYHAVNAGLDMGIVNPSMLQVYDDIEPEMLRCVEDVILDKDPGATERLIEKAQRTLEENAAAKENPEAAQKPREGAGTVEERLLQALVKGGSETLRDDVLEALGKLGKAVDVIEGPLMAGMAKVGELFGSGRMFLPQVVKSARTMKEAVSVLEPFMKEEDSSSSQKPRIVFATVKGDVHDIGKNITGIVMTCNGIQVTDLGVMVPKEDILAKAEEIHADLIGVSGLITPSLFQMEELCREMAARNMTTPLLVGGATTSALHTAVKLSPIYDHVFYGSDASSSAVLANRLVSDRKETERVEHAKQKELRDMYENAGKKTAATEKSLPFPADSFLKGSCFENIVARQLSMDELLPYFDWSLFMTIWGIRSTKSEQALKLRSEAEAMIDSLREGNGLRTTISARFDACHSEGDDIVSNDFRLPMPRQKGGLSLSDFVAPREYGFESTMGMFAISVHRQGHPAGCTCQTCTNEYASLLERSIRLTLAEAASEWLSRYLEERLPEGSSARIVKPAAGYASCPDHTLKRDILRLLPGSEELGIQLLESCSMIPDSTICAFIFVHPEASYPEIRRIGKEAVDEYAARRGMNEEEKRMFLGNLV